MVLFIGLSAVEDAWPAMRGPGRWVAGTLFVVVIIVAGARVLSLVRLLLDAVVGPKVETYDAMQSLPVGGRGAARDKRWCRFCRDWRRWCYGWLD